MGRVAYLFPGQGSQEVGMGRAFAAAVPASAEVFAQVDEALSCALSALLEGGPAATLALTEHTQPAVLTASVAALRAARVAGLPAADFVAGHSAGEYAALVAAEVLSLEDAARIVRARGRFMQEAVPVGVGAMAAVLALPAAVVAEICLEIQALRPGEVVVAANINGPDQVVIAGHAGAVQAASERLKAKGARRVVALDVSAPFHSPLMAPVGPRLAQELAGVRFRDPVRPVVTNVEAAPESSGERLRSLLVEQVTAPVRWAQTLARLAAEGCDTFIELGHGTVLSGLARRQVAGARVYAVSDPATLAQAIAGLRA